MRSPAKTLCFCAIGVAVASAGGISLASFAEGGAFSFYKQRAAPWPQHEQSEASPSDWAYPINSPAAQVSSAGPLPFGEAETALVQLDEVKAVRLDLETDPPLSEVADRPSELLPASSSESSGRVIQMSSNAWSEPAATTNENSPRAISLSEETDEERVPFAPPVEAAALK